MAGPNRSGGGGVEVCRQRPATAAAFPAFHGSFLLHLDVSLAEKALPLPSRQPDYRVNRTHADFLINLKVPPQMVKNILIKTWAADGVLDPIPFDQITRLAKEKYSLTSGI